MNRIPGTRYWATEEGRIVSPRGKVLKGTPNASGYSVVYAGGGRGAQVQYVHRLVARAFLGYPMPGQEVCHYDGNPANNRPGNLRYGTSSDNNFDLVRHGRHGMANRTHCPQGHEYTASNTRIGKSGSRFCKQCARNRSR